MDFFNDVETIFIQNSFLKGRIIALPRASYFDPQIVHKSMNTFLDNAIIWLAKQKKKGLAVGSHFQYSNMKYKKDLQVFPPDELGSRKNVSVYVVNAEEDKSDEEVKAIVKFVENGGGLLIGGQSWFYGNLPTLTYPGNR